MSPTTSSTPVICRADSNILMDLYTVLIIFAQRSSSVLHVSLWQPLCSHGRTCWLSGSVCYKNLHTSMCSDHTWICEIGIRKYLCCQIESVFMNKIYFVIGLMHLFLLERFCCCEFQTVKMPNCVQMCLLLNCLWNALGHCFEHNSQNLAKP